MSNTLSINIAGLDATLAEIKAYPQDVERIINREFTVFAQGTVNDAKSLAPVDEGRLRQSIGFVPGELQITITVNVDYAAYLEFGTKSFADAYVASLPQDWQVFAAQYKGAGGGNFQEMVMRIKEWVKRKGFASTYSVGSHRKTRVGAANEDQAAYAIAVSIVRKGIRPHPYLFPAFEKNKLELIANLKAQLNAK